MSQERKLPSSEGQLVVNQEQLVASIDKDAFRAMFYMFAGKPDSKHETFKGRVTLTPTALIDLNTRIQSKFQIHNVEETITTVSLSLDNSQALDFGTWPEFVEHDWRDPAALKDLTIRWDFMLRIASFAQAQRHTLNVTFAGNASPAAMLRVVLDSTETPQELDLSKMFGGCIARVDFISHSLADELLALVGKWHATLPKSEAVGTFFERCEKNDQRIAFWVHHSFMVLCVGVAYFGLEQISSKYAPTSALTVQVMSDFCLWFLAVTFLLLGANAFGKYIANRAFKAITNYGAHHTFQFTPGDDELRKKLIARNAKNATNFCIHIGQAIAVHALTSLITAYLVGNH